MWDELSKAVKENVVERLSSPLLGSFSATWCAVNYRFLLVLFSDNTVTDTLILIKLYAFPDWGAVFTKGLFFPLMGAAIYVFGYPFAARFVYWWSLKQQQESNNVAERQKGRELLSQEQSDEWRRRYRELEMRTNTEISSLKNENSDYRMANAQLQDQVMQLTAKKDKFKEVLNGLAEESLQHLRTVDRLGPVTNLEKFMEYSRLSEAKAYKVLEDCKEKGLVAFKTKIADGTTPLLLTPLGMGVLELAQHSRPS